MVQAVSIYLENWITTAHLLGLVHWLVGHTFGTIYRNQKSYLNKLKSVPLFNYTCYKALKLGKC